MDSAHLSGWATWMHLDGPPSWWQWGRPQAIDEAEDFPEQFLRGRRLASMHHLPIARLQ